MMGRTSQNLRRRQESTERPDDRTSDVLLPARRQKRFAPIPTGLIEIGRLLSRAPLTPQIRSNNHNNKQADGNKSKRVVGYCGYASSIINKQKATSTFQQQRG